jgi:hypothetical protein
LAAYRGFWAARIAASAHPNDDQLVVGLERYAIDKALADGQSSLFVYRKEGIEYRGKPVIAPHVTSVALGEPPKVMITDCVDSSNWTPVYAETGQSAEAPGQHQRVVTESMATVFAGRWVIRTHQVFRARPC